MTKKLLIDASLFKHSNCLRDVQNTLVHGYKPVAKNYKMEYGTAFHKFAQEYRTSGDVAKGITLAALHYSNPETQAGIPATDFRVMTHLMTVCKLYADTYNWKADRVQPVISVETNLPALEAKFEIPYRKEGDWEISLAGTIDMLGFDYNEPVVMDYKTTAKWDARAYLATYNTSPQLMMYKFITEKVAREIYPETFGVFKDVAGIIDGIFIRKPTPANPQPVIFQRSEPIHFSADMMTDFRNSLDRFIDRVLGLLVTDTQAWPRNFTCCDQGYKSEDNPDGCCPFLKSCCAEDYETTLEFLARDFVSVPYNPMLFQT